MITKTHIRTLSQSGSAHLAIILVVLVATVVGYTGYRLQRLSHADANTVVVNDTSTGTGTNQFSYSGSWSTSKSSVSYNQDNHYTFSKTSSYTVSFSGTQIKVYSENSDDKAIIAYSIDGGTATNVDQYAVTRTGNLLVYSSPTLPNGIHILKAFNTATKNSKSTAYAMVADRVDISTPVVPPTPSPTNPSGQAMPTGDLPGWKQIFADDFTTDVSIGNFPGKAYASTWDAGYAYGAPDTAGKTNGGQSVYYPSKVLSVSNGSLDMYLHSENGVSMAAAPMPKITNTWPFNGQTYGRYAIRFKSDALKGYKTAWMLWPDSSNQTDGEIDFPEGGLSGTMAAYSHCVTKPSINCSAKISTTTYTDWHTAIIEWAPGSVKFYLDGVLLDTATHLTPTKSMHYLLQTESCSGGCPTAGEAGHLDIDWVTMYSYNP